MSEATKHKNASQTIFVRRKTFQTRREAIFVRSALCSDTSSTRTAVSIDVFKTYFPSLHLKRENPCKCNQIMLRPSCLLLCTTVLTVKATMVVKLGKNRRACQTPYTVASAPSRIRHCTCFFQRAPFSRICYDPPT